MTMFIPIYYLYLVVIDFYMHMHILNRVKWLIMFPFKTLLLGVKVGIDKSIPYGLRVYVAHSDHIPYL